MQSTPEYRVCFPAGKRVDTTTTGVGHQFKCPVLESRNEATSTGANLSTSPDLSSVTANVLEDWIAANIYQHLSGEPLLSSPLEKSSLVRDAGGWGYNLGDEPCASDLHGASLDRTAFLWRLEPVTLDDIEVISGLQFRNLGSVALDFEPIDHDDPQLRDLGSVTLDDIKAIDYNDPQLKDLEPKLHAFVSASLHRAGSFRFLNPLTLGPLAWTQRYAPQSTTAPSESTPGLTEDNSRCSNTSYVGPPLSQHERFWRTGEEAASSRLEALWAARGGLHDSRILYNCNVEDLNEANLAGSALPDDNRDSWSITSSKPVASTRASTLECNLSHSGEYQLEYSEYTSSDDESSDSGSIWAGNYLEGNPALADNHPFQLVQSTVVSEAFRLFQGWKQHPQGSTSCSSATRETPDSGSKSQGESSAGRKRSRESGRGNKEERDERLSLGKRARTSKKASRLKLSFACPFAKRDPLTHRDCYMYVLSRIRDVKQHISRCHKLPIYCAICRSVFTSEEDRDEHTRFLSCVRRDDVRYDGVTAIQADQLSQRVLQGMSGEDQWFTIFDILFPEGRTSSQA